MTQNTSDNSQLIKFLTEFKCNSPVFPNDWAAVVRVRNDATISQALKILIDNKVQAVPVVDHTSGKPLYILSMMNILDYLLQVFTEDDFKTDVTHQFLQWLEGKPEKVAQEKLTVIEQKIDYKLDDAVTIDETASILDALKLSIDNHAHRVLALNSEGRISNLITQSRIIQFVAVMLDNLPKTTKTLEELKLGVSPVLTISENSTAFQAFKLMREKRISGLAVVNDDGKLVGSISASDLKIIGYDVKFWNLLGLPVKQYLRELNKASHPEFRSHLFLWAREPSGEPIVIQCKKTDTLKFAVKLLNFYRVHRVYVVDENNRPVSILTLREVLQSLLE
jgi:CBS domain-containing protein